MCGSVFVIRIHKAPEYGSNADPDPQQWLLVFGKENNRIPVPVLGKIPKEWFCFVNIFLYKNCIPVLSKFNSIHDVSSDRVESIPVFFSPVFRIRRIRIIPLDSDPYQN